MNGRRFADNRGKQLLLIMSAGTHSWHPFEWWYNAIQLTEGCLASVQVGKWSWFPQYPTDRLDT